MHSTCHKQWGKFLSFFILDNCWISRCPVSYPTNSIAMETLIMYFLMWGFEIDMGERGDAVKHVSEYQSSSLAVNNDSTVSCWNLAGLSERVAKETVNEINLQFLVRRLRETWRSKTGNQEFTGQIFRSVIICVLQTCTHTEWWCVEKEPWSILQVKKTAFSVIQPFLYKTVMKSNLWGTFQNAINLRCNYICSPLKHKLTLKLCVNHDSKTENKAHLTRNQQQ